LHHVRPPAAARPNTCTRHTPLHQVTPPAAGATDAAALADATRLLSGSSSVLQQWVALQVDQQQRIDRLMAAPDLPSAEVCACVCVCVSVRVCVRVCYKKYTCMTSISH